MFLKKLGGYFFIGILFSFFLYSCSNKENSPNVTAIPVQYKSYRFDQDFAKIDTNNIPSGLVNLAQKYPDFLDFFLDTVLSLNIHHNYKIENPGVGQGVYSFLTHKDYRGLLDTMSKHYPDTKNVDAQLKWALQYLKYYYPTDSIPKIIYFPSYLRDLRATWPGNGKTIAVGLDMFLGPNYPFYKSVEIPDYLTTQLTPANIPVNVMRLVYQDKHPFIKEDKNLLELMLQRGMEQYFLSKTLPFVPENIRLGFTEKQFEWCNKNEGLIYNFFVKQNMLYSTDAQQISRYINEGPQATGMPEGSPGNVGTYIGYRIINAFVNRNKTLTLENLFNQKDAAVVLTQSHFKP